MELGDHMWGDVLHLKPRESGWRVFEATYAGGNIVHRVFPYTSASMAVKR